MTLVRCIVDVLLLLLLSVLDVVTVMVNCLSCCRGICTISADCTMVSVICCLVVAVVGNGKVDFIASNC